MIQQQLVYADDISHSYDTDEAVSLWVNTIGPFANPQETYPYYKLPFCKPTHGIETHKRPSGIGEVLEGYELVNSGFKLHFASKFENLYFKIYIQRASLNNVYFL